MSRLTGRSSRDRCLAVIASLPVPDPFDLERFRSELEAERGRPLLLLPTEIATGCSGMWVGAGNADFIFYARDTTAVHQRHIVVHEIGHMVFDHQGTKAGAPELARLLFPDLSPDLVQSCLGRTAYSDDEERDAETFASILLGRARFRPANDRALRPGDAALLQRVESAFGPAHTRYGK